MRQKQRVFSLFLLSPSSRRAWIEISGHLLQISGSLSAGQSAHKLRRSDSSRSQSCRTSCRCT